MQHSVRLADAVVGACHEGVVLDRVAEDHQLCAADGVLVACEVSRLFDNLAHHFNRVHVDSSFGGAKVDRGADALGAGQRLGNGVDQVEVPPCKALGHQRGEPADKVDADFVGGFIQGFGVGHIVRVIAGPRNQRNGRHRDALVDDWNAKLSFDAFALGYQVFSHSGNFVINFAAGFFAVGVDAVHQRDPHGNGTDIQIFLLDHTDGFKHIFKHCHRASPLKWNAWH